MDAFLLGHGVQCKNNALLLFLQDFVGRIAVRKIL